MEKCISIWGHKFEGRFNSIPPGEIGNFKGNTYAFEVIIDRLTQKIYVHDICVRCGHIIKPTPATEGE